MFLCFVVEIQYFCICFTNFLYDHHHHANNVVHVLLHHLIFTLQVHVHISVAFLYIFTVFQLNVKVIKSKADVDGTYHTFTFLIHSVVHHQYIIYQFDVAFGSVCHFAPHLSVVEDEFWFLHIHHNGDVSDETVDVFFTHPCIVNVVYEFASLNEAEWIRLFHVNFATFLQFASVVYCSVQYQLIACEYCEWSVISQSFLM